MKKHLLFLFGLLLASSMAANAQKVTSGSFDNIADKYEVNVVFDYSNVKFSHTDKTVEEMMAENSKFAKAKDKQERYFLGSLNDEIKDKLSFGSYKKPAAELTVVLSRLRDDMDNPRFVARFTDPEGNVLLTIDGVEQEDLNDAGHLLGKFIYKHLKKK